MDYGDYEGLDTKAIPSDDEVIIKWNTAPGNLTFPNGDNVASRAECVYNGLLKIAGESSSNTIACVTHKTTIRMVVAKILKINLDYLRSIPCSNCSVTRVEYCPDKGLKLITLNADLDWLCNC